MHTVTHKQILTPDVKRIDLSAPAIVAKTAPGQFVMVTPVAGAKPVPLTIVETDERRGTLSLIVHEVGPSTKALGGLSIGEAIEHLTGPLGTPSFVEKYGLVACVATGIGAAQILPVCRALKKKGNRVIGILGAKSKSELLLEAQMRVQCDEIFIATNDGSYQYKGLATGILRETLEKFQIRAIYAIGAVEMMREASRLAKARGIPVRVTVNAYMTNGLGMCGSCRVKVNDRRAQRAGFRLACIEGPEFDGYDIDFDDLSHRDKAMKEWPWQGRNRLLSPKSGGFTTLVKSFWGMAKNKI